VVGPGQGFIRSNCKPEIPDRAIVRQHQMVAVVDDHAERRVAVGAAAAAGLGGTVAESDRAAGLRKGDGCGKS
jgi:hypothetical protein